MLKKIWYLQAPANESESSSGSAPSSTSSTTPSATPAAETAAEDPSAVQDTGGDDWDFLADSDDDGTDGEQTPPGSAASDEEAGKPPVVPAVKATEETPAATPAAVPAQTPAAAAETPKPAATPAKTVEELQAETTAATQRHLETLEAWYELPKEVKDQLETDEVAALPKILPALAAKVHQAVLGAALAEVSRYIPQAIAQFNQVSQVETQAKDTFYTRWPDLKEHEPMVLQAGAMYRQLNPNATREQALEGVGAMVYAAMGKPVAAAAPAASGTPAAAATPSPARTPATAAFRPAGTGGGAAPATPPKGGNEFENLADEFLTEDGLG